MIITNTNITEGFKMKAQLRPPSKPINVYATILSNTIANVAFTASADEGDSPIIGYTAITYPGNYTTDVGRENTGNITVTGLTPGTRYTFSVISNNSDAPSANSNSSIIFTTWDIPGPPTGQIFRLSNTTANIYYTLSSNTGNTAPIALIAQSNTGTILGRLHSISGSSTGNLLLTGLSSNTNYTIQIGANNLAGLSTLTTLTPFTTSLLPDAPTIIYVNPTSGSTANIVFNAPENIGSGIISYTANANGIAYATVVQSGAGNVSVSGLTPNTTYSFNLIATSSAGNSLPSFASVASTWGANVTPAANNVGEGNTLTINVVTFNVPSGTTLYWTTNHITTSNIDFVSNIDSGSFTVTSGTGSFTVTPVSDSTSEGPETFTLSIRSSNINGTVMATSSSTIINDTSITVPGQTEYTTAGTYTWTAPANVISISIVCVGAGGGGWKPNQVGGGGGGGALVWVNNIPVISGNTYTVTVGTGGAVDTVAGGSNTWFISNTYIMAGAGRGGSGAQNAPFTVGAGGTYINNSGAPGGGGTGGNGGAFGGPFGGTGGGGAAGYSGTGGTGGTSRGSVGTAGTGGGGGGGGAVNPSGQGAGAGGGVGIYGEGPNGTGGTGQGGGTGGSGGTTGDTGGLGGAVGGRYGGGGGGGTTNQNGPLYAAGPGTSGAVRIIWPGVTRQYPSTNTANL